MYLEWNRWFARPTWMWQRMNLYSKASHCELYQPIGICIELNNVVYVAGYKSSCIKIASTMICTSSFLSAIGKLTRSFCINEKKGDTVFLRAVMITDRLFLNLLAFRYISNYDGFIGLFFFSTSNVLFTLAFPCSFS